MATLLRGSQQLFSRSSDETFATLDKLVEHCESQKEASQDCWEASAAVRPVANVDGSLRLNVGTQFGLVLNDWSFTQLCHVAKTSKETVNRLSTATAVRVFDETLPTGNKPLQVFTQGRVVRSVHGVGYNRVHNADLLDIVRDAAPDFVPPQTGMTGGTGLYCGEQDMFAFLIDPTGWVEVEGEAFAPGFFLWNSEVGKRTLGVETFWFQAVCQNHIVWDAIEVLELSRKHTANVRESFEDIRMALANLVAKRDARRDSFASVVKKAMQARLGANAEEVAAQLAKHGISRTLGKRALEIAARQGRFTIFALVDALTRLSAEVAFIGDRTDIDVKTACLLELAIAA